jgi:hypothetical protein
VPSRHGACPSLSLLSWCSDSAGAASAWAGSLAFGGAISSLKAVTVPMRSGAAPGDAVPELIMVMPVIAKPISVATDAVGAARSIKVRC